MHVGFCAGLLATFSAYMSIGLSLQWSHHRNDIIGQHVDMVSIRSDSRFEAHSLSIFQTLLVCWHDKSRRRLRYPVMWIVLQVYTFEHVHLQICSRFAKRPGMGNTTCRVTSAGWVLR